MRGFRCCFCGEIEDVGRCWQVLCEVSEEQALWGGGGVESLGHAVVARVHPQIIQIVEAVLAAGQQRDRVSVQVHLETPHGEHGGAYVELSALDKQRAVNVALDQP